MSLVARGGAAAAAAASMPRSRWAAAPGRDRIAPAAAGRASPGAAPMRPARPAAGVSSRGLGRVLGRGGPAAARWPGARRALAPPTAAAAADGPASAPADAASDAAAAGRQAEAGEGAALLRAAGVAGGAALICKALGLTREVVTAGMFGVGPVVDGFNYACIVPGTFMVLLGGINGPFHSAMAATLARRPKSQAGAIVEAVSTVVGAILLPIAVLVFVLAGPLIDLAAPGLAANGAAGAAARAVAVVQLQIMAPMVALSGLVGVGFGALSASGRFAVPALAPALTSLAVLAALGGYAATGTAPGVSPLAGGAALALGVAGGSLMQWAAQAAAQTQAGLGRFLMPSLEALPQVAAALAALRARMGFNAPDPVARYAAVPGAAAPAPSPAAASSAAARAAAAAAEAAALAAADLSSAVREVFSVLLPATIASGMLQIATFTDLYFASFIPNAAAGLGYANLLAMAPLGVLSSALLLPALPLFARLAAPERWPELKERIRQALTVAAACGLCLAALLVPNAPDIAKMVYQRRAFDGSASILVGSLLRAYAIGAPAYLARDVLVRAFYALGDGKAPFVVSAAAIASNAVLDWLFTRRLGLGAPGLVLATAAVNVGSAVALLALLSKRLGGLELAKCGRSMAVLTAAAAAAAAANYGGLALGGPPLRALVVRPLAVMFGFAPPAAAWLADAAAVGASAGLALAVFGAALVLLRLPETAPAVDRLAARFGLRLPGSAALPPAAAAAP